MIRIRCVEETLARLYPEQEQVIAHVLGGKDVLVVLPTGFGKSACYQLPSMILPKPSVQVWRFLPASSTVKVG